MSLCPLAALLAIRDRVARLAAKELSEARRRLAAAQAEERRLANKLADYRARKEAEKDRRWGRFLGSKTTLEGLDNFKEGLAALDRREADLEMELEEAAQAVRKALTEEENAQQELLARTKAREKLERHREIWLAAEALERERLEALEMEEFTRPATGPAD